MRLLTTDTFNIHLGSQQGHLDISISLQLVNHDFTLFIQSLMCLKLCLHGKV